MADHEHGQACHDEGTCNYAFRTSEAVWHTRDAPPIYSASSITEKLYAAPEVVETIEKRIEELDGELRELSIKIHDHPELMFEEQYAHDTLTAFMEVHGFQVERHYFLKTAWSATFTHGQGGRVLGFNSEMDALPGIGHACGHNLIAIGGVAAALGVKAAMEKHNISGKILLLGTPAEEGGAGKAILIEKGAYEEMDICLMCHPGPGPEKAAGTGPSLAISGYNVEFFGHTSHASAAPWEGQNALDAAFLAYSAISVLRQQIKPSHRVHGIVEGRDWAPNIIPDYAMMRWLIRAPSRAEVEELAPRVHACFEAAALATGCKVTMTKRETMYDLRQNEGLAHEFTRVAEGRYGMKVFPKAAGAIGGSTDFGNVTYVVPGLHPAFAIPTIPGGGNHTIGFTQAARTPEAHAITLVISKILAQVGYRALTDEGFLKEVKSTFKKED